MKNRIGVFFLVIFVLTMFACDFNFKKDNEIQGTWKRETINGNYTLIFNKDKTFTESCDNNAMDPNYWYGTYEYDGNTLTQIFNEVFLDITITIISTATISSNELTLTFDDNSSKKYIREK